MPTLLLRRVGVILVGVLLQAVAQAASPPPKVPRLTSPPLGERWFSINLNGERTGFFSMKIEPVVDGYEVTAAGSVKMLVLGFSREASAREFYRVGKDLALRSFAVEQAIDRSPKKVSGTMTDKGVKVSVESGGRRTEKLLKAKGPVYPPPLLNLVPLRDGILPGKALK